MTVSRDKSAKAVLLIHTGGKGKEWRRNNAVWNAYSPPKLSMRCPLKYHHSSELCGIGCRCLTVSAFFSACRSVLNKLWCRQDEVVIQISSTATFTCIDSLSSGYVEFSACCFKAGYNSPGPNPNCCPEHPAGPGLCALQSVIAGVIT